MQHRLQVTLGSGSQLSCNEQSLERPVDQGVSQPSGYLQCNSEQCQNFTHHCKDKLVCYNLYRLLLQPTSVKCFLDTLSLYCCVNQKACQKLLCSTAYLLSCKIHFRLVLSLQCPLSLNTRFISHPQWHRASLHSSFLPSNSDQLVAAVGGYCSSLTDRKKQIVRVLQKCKTGCSTTLPLQLLGLFVC